MDPEKVAACALNTIFGFEPRAGRNLLEAVGSAREVFRLGRDDLRAVIGPNPGWLARIGPSALRQAERDLETAAGAGACFVSITEPDYPLLLRDIEDPPLGLFFRGTDPPAQVWNHQGIAIVGTRDMSAYGREWCQRLVAAIAGCREKPLIVSGLALGIDGVAHEAALAGGLPTLAVMATGIETVYPYSHTGLARRIAGRGGSGLLTDFPPGTAPVAVNFLRRNRIIAGLARATVLVESKRRGGGMVTARLAVSYGRELYALPGRVDDLRSQGCNQLLREQLAEAVSDPESFVASLGLSGNGRIRLQDIPERVEACYGDRPEEEKQLIISLLRLIKRNREISLQELSTATGAPFSRVASLSAMLQADGLIYQDILQRCSIRIK